MTYEERVRELSRKSKPELARIYRANGTYLWSQTPPEKWSRDELVSAVLAAEFPGRTQA